MANEPPVNAAPPQCDLVMKGGITSGVVYPKLIAQLAAKYRFKNIGGTSAGAIAAAACAAAEHRRQSSGDSGGFDALSQLPAELGESKGRPARSMLFHLFQPAAPVAKHFAVLVSMLNKAPLTAVGHALLAMVVQFWGMVLLGAVLGLLLFEPVVRMACTGCARCAGVLDRAGAAGRAVVAVGRLRAAPSGACEDRAAARTGAVVGARSAVYRACSCVSRCKRPAACGCRADGHAGRRCRRAADDRAGARAVRRALRGDADQRHARQRLWHLQRPQRGAPVRRPARAHRLVAPLPQQARRPAGGSAVDLRRPVERAA